MKNLGKEHINFEKISKADFDRLSAMEKVDLFSQGFCLPEKQTKEELFKSIQVRMNNSVVERPVRKMQVIWSAAASVALIVLLALGYNYLNTENLRVVAVDKGEHRELLLPDGSQLKINADSKLTFSEAKFAKNRELELSGEAYFSVQKGSRFAVS